GAAGAGGRRGRGRRSGSGTWRGLWLRGSGPETAPWAGSVQPPWRRLLPAAENRGFPLRHARLVCLSQPMQGEDVLRPEGILALLASRSFGSIWFWVILTLAWTMAGRRILGVPSDVIAGAIGAEPGPEDDPAALTLLDWLSLTLPRWRVDRR